jgi:uncharacterized integral membrane protein
MLLSLILLIVITVVGVILALENAQAVSLTFFGYAMDGPVGLFLLIALGVGIILGILLMIPSLLGKSWSAFRQQQKIAELEKKPVKKKK